MNPSDKRTLIVLAAALLLLLAIAVPTGVGIATSSERVFGPYTDHLFLLLNTGIIACAVWATVLVVRDLKRRRRLATAIVFVVYLVVVVVVGFDGVLELFPRLIPPRVLANLPFGGGYFYSQGTATHELRSDLGIKPRPHVNVEVFYVNDLVRYGQISPVYDYPTTHILFATDSQGFRNSDEATTADVVVLGDSFTELPYMRIEDVWPSLLAQRTGWKVRNLAVSGYGPMQQAVVLQKWGLAYRPRLVVLGFYEGNDILDCADFDAFRRSGLPYFKWVVRRFSKPSDWFKRRPVVAILQMLLLPYERIAERWSGENSRTRAMRRSYFNPVEVESGGERRKIGLLSLNLMLLSADADKVRSQPGWPLCQDALREMKETCEKAGATFVLVYIPTKEHVYLPLLRNQFTPEAVHDFVAAYHTEAKAMGPDEFEAALYANMDATERVVEDFCRTQQIAFCDLTAPFRQAARQGQLIYFAFDSHWNAVGNQIAADTIERFLRDLNAGGSR